MPEHNESIRFECDATEKQLLRDIASISYGSASMSATLRMMIREKAGSLGLLASTIANHQAAAGNETGEFTPTRK